jgi:hypothetical protein
MHWRALAIGLLAALMLALPWHLFELLSYGASFVHDYALIHAAKVTDVETDNGGDLTFYFNVLGEGLPRWM